MTARATAAVVVVVVMVGTRAGTCSDEDVDGVIHGEGMCRKRNGGEHADGKRKRMGRNWGFRGWRGSTFRTFSTFSTFSMSCTSCLYGTVVCVTA